MVAPRRGSRRIRRSMASAAVTLFAVMSMSNTAHAQSQQLAMYEPPDNKILFGAWIDTQLGDTAEDFNNRIGYNTSIIQIAQQMPLPVYNYTTGGGGPAPERIIETSSTDAAVFLTVYPSSGFGVLSQADFDVLAEQVSVYDKVYNRTVFLRFAPEMQGTWNVYGQQPTAFLSAYTQLYHTVKAVAPNTIMVWAPNTGQGYPYSQSFSGSGPVGPTSAEDQQRLDTNKNGRLDAGDDPYSPYYPGDDYVDWLGVSVYYKGPSYSDINRVQDPGFCSSIISGINPTNNQSMIDFYGSYCTKPGKACMFAESGAAYHTYIDSGASQVDLQQGWVQGCLTNTSFFDQFPRLKLMMHFEYLKNETSASGTGEDLRDYRLTNNTDVLNMFRSNLATMATRVAWASYRSPLASSALPSNGQLTPAASGTSASGAITATYRERPTTFPSLFGGSSTLGIELINLTLISALCIAGSVTLLRLI